MTESCAECQAEIRPDEDRVETEDDRVFCMRCYARIADYVESAVSEQGRDINYPLATLGAIAGGAVGAAVWWGFTVATQIAFGLIAIVIGFTVGHGVLILGGHKRSRGLQAMSAGVATLSFFVASYLVNRSQIHQELSVQLPLFPAPDTFVNVVKLGFDVMDFVFLALVVWEAWRIPQPVEL